MVKKKRRKSIKNLSYWLVTVWSATPGTRKYKKAVKRMVSVLRRELKKEESETKKRTEWRY